MRLTTGGEMAYRKYTMISGYRAGYVAPELADLRRALGWSQADAARYLGVGHRTIQAWEAGETTAPPAVLALLRIYADPRCPDWIASRKPGSLHPVVSGKSAEPATQ
jgi:DNA-binding XRE family transcriptional regulator